MKYAGVISGTGRKSLSPVLQQAAIDSLGLDLVYEAWPTPPDGLETRVSTLRGAAVLGANVTIPHKETIVPLLDELDPLTKAVGAVNTVINDGGVLRGHNTDVGGFLRALRDDGGLDPIGKRALVAGAGGAARAVIVALMREGAASVTAINRTFSRASRLVDSLRDQTGSCDLSALPDIHASWAASSIGCDVLVNCTPAGSDSSSDVGTGFGIPLEILHSGMLVYDLVYLPAETGLMAAARQRGARVLGGLPMLIYQGAESFKLWTGCDAPIDVMMTAAKGALGIDGGESR